MKDRSRKSGKVRLQKKPKNQFFNSQNPYYEDKKLRNRAEILSAETDLRYNQSLKTRKPKLSKGKQKEEEILAKETKQSPEINKNKRKSKKTDKDKKK